MPLLTCPNDGNTMQEINRNGVLIDICPSCRGVWLDRGEMEKLLGYLQDHDYNQRSDKYRDDDHNRRGDNYRKDDWDDDREYKQKKKRSIFDFFD